MRDKTVEKSIEGKPTAVNEIDIVLTNTIAMCGSQFSGYIVKIASEKIKNNDFTVRVSAKRKEFLTGDKTEFENGVRSHVKGSVRFIYG